jgi:preprotein translocase subunit SecB
MNIQIQHSNIELEGYYVRELQFSVQPAGIDEAGKMLLTRGFHVQLEKPIEIGEYQITLNMNAASHHSDSTRYRLVLSIATGDPSPENQAPPYKFHITLVGYFRLVGLTIPKPTREPAIVQASVSILYSSAREILAAATARGPFPGMILPVMNISLTNPTKPLSAAVGRPAKKRLPKKVTRKK